MGDARVPPAGPPPRDPTAPARLLDAAAEVGLRVERAQRQLDGLERAVDRLADATGLPPGRPRAPSPPAGDDEAGGDPQSAPRAAVDEESPSASPAPGDEDPPTGPPPSSASAPAPASASAPAPASDAPRPPLAGASGPAGTPGGVPGPPHGSDAQEHDAAEVPLDRPAAGAVLGTTPDLEDPVPDPEDPYRPDERSRRMLPAAIQSYGAQIAVAALGLLNVIVMARALGAAGRGEVAFLTAIAFLGSNLWTFGVQEANVNLAGAEPATRPALATNSVILSGVLGGAGALLIAAFIWIVPAAGAGVGWGLIWLILASIPMLVLNTYLRFLIQGDYGFGITNLAWFLPAVINVTVTVAFALLGALSVTVAVLTWVGGQTFATLLMIWHVQRRSVGFGHPSAGLARRTLGFGVKSHIGRIMLLANYRLDQWILGAVAGTKQLGQYSVAVAWAEALFLLPTALSAVQRPAIVRAAAREAVALTARVFRISLLVTGVLGVGLVIFAPVLCVTIFGEEFRDSVADLRVLAGGAFGVVALKQIGNALTGRDHPLAASLSIGSAFVFTVVLDILLIPAYGDLGAAIASSVAYTLGGAVIIVVATRTLGARPRDLVPRPSDVRDAWALVNRALGRGPKTAADPAA